jgi:hypothetical protein
MAPDDEDSGPSQLADLVAVIDAFDAMWNIHDLEGILNCFTDDAMVTLIQRPDEGPTVYHGQAAIRTLVQTYLPGGYIRGRSHYRAETDRLVWMARVSADCFKQLGVDWIEWKAEATVRSGKIASYTVTPTSESLAKLDTAKRRSERET